MLTLACPHHMPRRVPRRPMRMPMPMLMPMPIIMTTGPTNKRVLGANTFHILTAPQPGQPWRDASNAIQTELAPAGATTSHTSAIWHARPPPPDPRG